MDKQELLNSLDPLELQLEATPLVIWRMGVTDVEQIAAFMYRGGPTPPQMSSRPPTVASEDHRPEKKYWEFVKAEMHAFLCTDDKKYKSLWKEIKASRTGATSAVVGIISAFLAQSIGAVATVLSGFVAVCLFAAMKIGTEAYCKYSGGVGG